MGTITSSPAIIFCFRKFFKVISEIEETTEHATSHPLAGRIILVVQYILSDSGIAVKTNITWRQTPRDKMRVDRGRVAYAISQSLLGEETTVELAIFFFGDFSTG